MRNLRSDAEQFLNEQIELMRQHGQEPSLTEDDKKALIVEIERTFRRLAYPTDHIKSELAEAR